jgi:glycosyltransferase 2 family protein
MTAPDRDHADHARADAKKFPLKWLLMLAMTAVLVYLLVEHMAGGQELLDVVDQANWAIAAGAVALLGFTLSMATLRWLLILRAMGFEVGFLRGLRALLATRPFDVMVPSRANDLLRPLAVRDVVPLMEGSSSVICQRAIDVQSLCVLALVGGLATGFYHWAALAGLALLGAWTALGLLFWKRDWFIGLPLVRRFDDKLRSLARAFVALAQQPVSFAMVSAISLIGWAGVLGIVWTLSQAFAAGLAPLEILALWPLAIFVGMLPLTVAGMGTRDAAFLSLLVLASTAPVDRAAILAVTFGYAIVTTGVPATIGIPFMLKYMHRLPEPDAQASDGPALVEEGGTDGQG